MDTEPDLYIASQNSDAHHTWTEVALLLTCGHYTHPIYERSSLWDFLHEPFKCRTCGEERQVDLRIQAAVGAGDWDSE
jgi:hypothetical protein